VAFWLDYTPEAVCIGNFCSWDWILGKSTADRRKEKFKIWHLGGKASHYDGVSEIGHTRIFQESASAACHQLAQSRLAFFFHI
jgi:hypothetical protein